jgi:hypothetical protein
MLSRYTMSWDTMSGDISVGISYESAGLSFIFHLTSVIKMLLFNLTNS